MPTISTVTVVKLKTILRDCPTSTRNAHTPLVRASESGDSPGRHTMATCSWTWQEAEADRQARRSAHVIVMRILGVRYIIVGGMDNLSADIEDKIHSITFEAFRRFHWTSCTSLCFSWLLQLFRQCRVSQTLSSSRREPTALSSLGLCSSSSLLAHQRRPSAVHISRLRRHQQWCRLSRRHQCKLHYYSIHQGRQQLTAA